MIGRGMMRIRSGYWVLLLLFLIGCREQEDVREIRYNAYVEAFSTGSISKKTPVTIVFRDTVPVVNRSADTLRAAVKISPATPVDILMAEDGRTMKISPKENFKPGTRYSVTVNIRSLFDQPGALPFEYFFSVFSPEAALHLLDFEVNADDECMIAAEITTRDDETAEEVEKAVRFSGKDSVRWAHSADGRRHQFWIEGIRKPEEESYMYEVRTVRNKIGLKESERLAVPIPVQGKFYLYDKRYVSSPERYVELIFSEQVDARQDLNGLVEIVEMEDIPAVADNNSIRLYLGQQEASEHARIRVDAGVRSRNGNRLSDSEEVTVETFSSKPDARFVGRGIILPENDSVNIAFQTINLRAVRIKVIKIFENNIGQFLQSDNLSDFGRLSEVGMPVACKTVLLDSRVNFDPGRWTTYALNLRDMMAPEPGALYHLELSFDRRFSTYDCGRSVELSPEELAREDVQLLQRDIDRFEAGGYYYYNSDYDWSDYDWTQRNNPCSDSYYVDKTVSRNVMMSNLALIVKNGHNGRMQVMANNILTGEPEELVDMRVYNYQHQMVAKGITDASGMADLVYGRTVPHYIIAGKGMQRAYLRVDRASALSLSNFEVWGEPLQKGIQGYLYGERGVWRPGDTLHLNLIVRDRFGKLPADHPVTFKLQNPLGQVYATKSVKGKNRFYAFDVPIAQNAPTGTWSVTASLGGARFQKNLRIETVKPNRLKVDLQAKPLLHKGRNTLTLKTEWLTGAVARNLKYSVKADFSAGKTVFEGYEDYVFDNPSKSFSGEQLVLSEGITDAEGTAVMPVDLGIGENAPGMLNVSLVTRVYETSGEYSINGLPVKYSPYDSYVGIALPVAERETMTTDRPYVFKLVDLKSDGSPAAQRRIDVAVYKVKWYWWWSSQRSDLADYLSDSYHTPVLSEELHTDSAGKASFEFSVPEKDWGTYVFVVTDHRSGHSSAVMGYFYDESARGEMREGDEATMLVLHTDKAVYETGDKVTLSFPSMDGAEAIVSLESGTEILETSRIKCSGTRTSFSFRATEAMLPNVYAYVTLIQPYGAVKNDMPIRLYGVVPVMVESENTRLLPRIEAPEQVKPMTKFDIEISEERGRPMTYTLAVVDEGLLDLTNFRTPDPWNTFFARQALGMDTWDSYQYIFGAYGGRIEQLFSIGGDGMLAAKNTVTVNRFKPVALSLGTFTLEKNKKQKHTVEIPNFAGTVRVMVVAANDQASGHAEREVKVVNPVMVLPTLPRVLSPGDTFDVGATVFAMEEGVGDIQVSLETGRNLLPQEDTRKTIRMAEKGDTTVYFRMKVSDRPGRANVKLRAEAVSGRSFADTEIKIRSVDVPVSTHVTRNVVAESSVAEKIALPGKRGTNKMLIEVSRVPSMHLSARLKYLEDYPYACVEQLVSGAFPFLYAGMLMQTDRQTLLSYENRVRSALSRLVDYQTSEDMLSYWPGGTDVSVWGTLYAFHFMSEAKDRGFSVPMSLYRSLQNGIYGSARQWQYAASPQSGEQMLVQAYRLYLLALAGNEEIGAMNRLYENPDLSGPARAMLATAYARIGRKNVAETLLRGNLSGAGTTYALTYGDENRNTAILLLANLGVNNGVRASELAYRIAGTLASDQWLSTQSVAFSLMAMSKYITAYPVPSEMDFSLQVDGKTFDAGESRGRSVLSFAPEVRKQEQSEVRLMNYGDGALFLNIWCEGVALPEEEQAYANGVEISRRFIDRFGRAVDIAALEQGTAFYSEITISNRSVSALNNLALEEVIPAGWEIENTLFGAISAGTGISYRDVRDDRICSFVDQLPVGGQITVRTPLSAAYKGRFYMPATRCEAMYNQKINANTAGRTVEVR